MPYDSHFVAGKVPAGKTEISTGAKLSGGKLPLQLFSVHTSDPMKLYDAFYGYRYPDGSLGLTGYAARKEHPITTGVGAGTQYTMFFKVCYANDTRNGGSGVDGTVTINGTQYGLVYLNQMCRTDFNDVAFALKGQVTPYTIDKFYVSEGDYALFAVNFGSDSLDQNQTVQVYCGNQPATDQSSANAYVGGKIPGVQLAAMMDEAEQEVSPIVIADGTAWGVQNWGGGGGSVAGSVSLDSQDTIVGQPSVIGATIAGTYQGWNLYKTAFTHDWTGKSVFRIYVKGTGSGKTYQVELRASDQSNEWRAVFYDTFIGWKYLSIPISSMTVVGSPQLSNVAGVYISWVQTIGDSMKIGRCVVDVGVPVTDWSGNNNNSTSVVGTTIVSSGFTGKTERQLIGATDVITFPSVAAFQTDTFTYMFRIKPVNTWNSTSMPRIIRVLSGNNGWELTLNSNSSTKLVFARNGTGAWAESKATTAALSTSQASHVVLRVAGTSLKIYINGILDTDFTLASAITPSSIGLSIGASSTANHAMMQIEDLVLIPSAIATTLINTAMATAYGDVKALSGTIMYRKLATTTEPSHGTWGAMETKIAYAVPDLYASQHQLNFTLDQTNKKAAIEFYVGNTQEESANVLILTPSNPAAFWNITGTWGTGTISAPTVSNEATIRQKDTNSLKISVGSGSVAHWFIGHTYGTAQNWSTYDFVGLRWYGQNTGATLQYYIKNSGGAVWNSYDFIDNFLGWKTIIWPRLAPSSTAGTLDWTTVLVLTVQPLTSNLSGSFYMERARNDIGSWAYVEFGVPDKLQTIGVNSKVYYRLYAYKQSNSTYNAVIQWDTANYVFYNMNLIFLDGTAQNTIVNSTYNYGGCGFDIGKRGSQPAKVYNTLLPAGYSITTYSKAKTRYRIGVAVKMPPHDRNASASTGIGQCKLKLEVYFV